MRCGVRVRVEGCGAHQRGERRSERPGARAPPRWRRPQRRCLRTCAAGCRPGRVRAPQRRSARRNSSAAGCSSAGARRRQGRRGGAAGAQGGWGRATPSALGRHRTSRRGSRAPAWPTCVAARGGWHSGMVRRRLWRFVRCATSLHATRERGRATPARGRQRLSQAPRDPTRRATRRSAAPAAGRSPSASGEPSAARVRVGAQIVAKTARQGGVGREREACEIFRTFARLQQNNNQPTT